MSRRERWFVLAVVVLFVAYAANFLYFFVDDEGIPFVYAQNLLSGRGLTYNTLEGRVEAYSDFLHVVQATLVLAVTNALGLPKLAVFFVGKAVSLAAGIAVVILVLDILRRLRVGRVSASTGMALLVLTGPFAVWSCSSLETVPAVATATLLLWALLTERDAIAALAATGVLLERIDGFVAVGALLAGFLVVVDAARRRALLRRVVVPVTVLFAVYHAGRVLYFGAWLPTPVAAKVLYKFWPHEQLVEKKPGELYALRFATTLGWPLVASVIAAAGAAIARPGPLRAVGIVTAVMAGYAAVIGDWMFGFRFFVPVLPFAAILYAAGANRLMRVWPRAAAAACAVSIGWCAWSGIAFFNRYRATQQVSSAVTHPSLEAARYFGPYYSAYEMARERVPRGALIADNQAGFVPFMLDANNVDDLGICSRFFADLPSTDVIFTEVGKYQPLSPAPPRRAGEAYLLYQDVRFLIVRGDLLRSANGLVPRSLLGGHFELAARDERGDNMLYRRTTMPADSFRTDPRSFLEDLAHVSYVRSATVDATPIAPSRMLSALPWLGNGTGYVRFKGHSQQVAVFGVLDEDVYHVTVEGLTADAPSHFDLVLKSADGCVVAQESRDLLAGVTDRFSIDLPPGARASRLEIEFRATDSSREVTARLTDIRVLGQRQPLRQFINARLHFPAGLPVH
jgi:hypothetical protein